MSREEQLGWEARVGPFAAAAAILSSVSLVAAFVVQANALGRESLDTERRNLTALSGADTGYLAAAGLRTLSYLLFAGALVYLFRVTKARRAETPSWAPPLALIGAVTIGAGFVVGALDVLSVADTFTSSGEQSNRRAEDLLDDRGLVGQGLVLVGMLALALSLVLIPLNAMRAGILSRFMGVLGIAIGVLSVIPLLLGPLIVQLFWSVALGFLFLGRWPGGRGPAWEAVEAIPWPSAARRRQEAMEGGDEQAGAIPADDPTIEPAADDEPSGDPSDPRSGPEHPVSRKRKKKRRR